MPTLDELNALDRAVFTESLGWIFEHSPWVADRAWQSRPFANAEALHYAMTAQVTISSSEEQLTLLRAHPDLATRARLSDASASEQSGAGLDRLTREEFDRFNALNNNYQEKFGFPFLFAVKGSTKHNILTALEQRLAASPDEEFAEALRQVYRIAEFRLRDYLSQEP